MVSEETGEVLRVLEPQFVGRLVSIEDATDQSEILRNQAIPTPLDIEPQ